MTDQGRKLFVDGVEILGPSAITEVRKTASVVAATQQHKAIITRGTDGLINGWLLPIWNSAERWGGATPQQVYMTVVLPGAAKGPHLHKTRSGAFTCVSGNIRITIRDEQGRYHRFRCGEDYHFQTVFVRPGEPALLECIGTVPAYVLNMPSPAWSKDEPDEWPVEDWNP